MSDSKREVPFPKRDVSSQPESKAVVPVRVPPKRPAKLEDETNNPILPVKPSPNNSHSSSKISPPDSRYTHFSSNLGILTRYCKGEFLMPWLHSLKFFS